MNVLILSWRGPGHPNAGGAEVSTHEHAKAWVKAGYNVTLFSSHVKNLPSDETIDGIRMLRRGNEVFGVQIAAFFWYMFGKHPDFDLVVDQFHGISFFTPLYVRVKKIAFIHEVTKEVWWLNPWNKPFNLIPGVVGSLFEPMIFKLLYKNIPFITVSESTKKDLIAFGIPAKNITVVHNGIMKVKPKPFPKKEKKKTVIFLGALTRDKGVEDVIKVFGLINKIDANWQFWIVGRGEESNIRKLKEKIANLGIGDKVKFWGFVSEEKKFELLARAQILINPSVREGWGLVNIEANYVGTPVVGYAVPGMTDSVKNMVTGILVQRGDTNALSTGILKLVSDSRSYIKFQKAGVEWSKTFDWKKSSEKSLKFISSL